MIIVSGAGMIADAIQALKRGAWDYVTKPIPDMQVLESAIVKALDRARLLVENREYQRRLEQVNRELKNALEQLKADQQAGRGVQTRLLPKPHQVLGGYAFRHRLYPAMYLSGDFVDYFPVDNRYIGFYMIDVSGHDTGSAFLTVMIKTIMLQMVNAFEDGDDDTILSPSLTLEKINTELNRQVLNKYITMFYGLIDTSRIESLPVTGDITLTRYSMMVVKPNRFIAGADRSVSSRLSSFLPMSFKYRRILCFCCCRTGSSNCYPKNQTKSATMICLPGSGARKPYLMTSHRVSVWR